MARLICGFLARALELLGVAVDLYRSLLEG
jgi:hypothetical protein